MNDSKHPTIKVGVDQRICEGHGLCLDLAPEVFDLTGEETACCAEQQHPSRLDDILAAAAACPRQAITVSGQNFTSRETT